MRKIAIVLAALGFATVLSAAVVPAQAHDWGMAGVGMNATHTSGVATVGTLSITAIATTRRPRI